MSEQPSPPEPVTPPFRVGGMDPVPLLWTSREAARALALSERTLFSLVKRGEVPCVRIGRAVRFDPRDLRTWIAARKNGQHAT
jgi:excisionase family DNA binding protein